MTTYTLSKSFILCFLLSSFGFHDCTLVSAQTIPTIDKFVHRGFGYFSNSNYVLEAATTSFDMCVYMCHIRIGCYGLSYKSTTSTCQLHAASVDDFLITRWHAPSVDSQYKLLVRQMQHRETCPDSSWRYLSSNKKCYKYFSTSKNFDDAELECNKYGHGGHLAQPSTDEEATLITAVSRGDIYLGIFRQDTLTNAYRYMDGRLIVLPTNIKWASGYTGQNPATNCILIGVCGQDPCWWEYYTYGVWYPYVCELPVLHG